MKCTVHRDEEEEEEERKKSSRPEMFRSLLHLKVSRKTELRCIDFSSVLMCKNDFHADQQEKEREKKELIETAAAAAALLILTLQMLS